MCDSDADTNELHLKSYEEYLLEVKDSFIIRCSNCNAKNTAKLWKEREAHCPNCGSYGWSVGF